MWLSCWAQEMRLGGERGPLGFRGAARGALRPLAAPPPLRQPLVVLPRLLGQGAHFSSAALDFRTRRDSGGSSEQSGSGNRARPPAVRARRLSSLSAGFAESETGAGEGEPRA